MSPDSENSPKTKNETHFYDTPAAQADFQLWARMSYWSADEATALLLWKNPEVVNETSFGDSNDASNFSEIYRKVRILTERAVETNYLTKQIDPHQFIEWARNTAQLKVPKELTTAIADLETSAKPNKTSEPVEQPLVDSERTSLLKLALGMAIKGYNYDPGKQKNEATGDNRGSIATDLERLGLDLTSDTVRKYLKEAEQRLGNPLKNSPKN